MLQSNDTIVREHNVYKTALEKIRSEYGKVCEEFELCTHVACGSSVGAWFTADKALNPDVYAEVDKLCKENANDS